MINEDIFIEFDESNNLIKEYEHWKVLVSNRSKTLGNCVVITKAHHKRFSELSQEEMIDFGKVVKELENALLKSFNYDKINWLMLMMKDNHTHFHAIPRYKETRQFAGLDFTDGFQPNAMGLPKLVLSQEIMNKIKEEIKKNI